MTATDAPRMDLRSHSMFSGLYGPGQAVTSVVADPDNARSRDRVRMRVLQRQLNNTHLAEHHVQLRCERELLACRRETFHSFADVGGIECPLLHSPAARIYPAAGRRRRNRQTANPDVLTLTWDASQDLPERTPFMKPLEEGREEEEEPPEWTERLAAAAAVQRQRAGAGRRPSGSPKRRGTKPRPSTHKSVTWDVKRGSEAAGTVPPLPPEALAALRRHRAELRPSGRPQFERYTIGGLPRPQADPARRVREVGLRVAVGGGRLVEAGSPAGPAGAERRRGSTLNPVTCALRRHGTAPEQVRWRTARSGELWVSTAWPRELSEFSNPPLIQMAREDTRHLSA